MKRIKTFKVHIAKYEDKLLIYARRGRGFIGALSHNTISSSYYNRSLGISHGIKFLLKDRIYKLYEQE